jgi:hypothetical protein
VKTLLIVAALGLVGVAMIFALQRKLIYFPDPSAPPLPPADAERGLEDVRIQAADGVGLRAWHRPAPDGRATVLVFHGNAGHRGDRLDLVRHLADLGLGVLALDYRGYGGSEGAPTEDGLYADAEAAVRWLEGRGFTRLVYFGESLGTGVAVELATRRAPEKLVLEAAFDSAVAVGKRAYPILPVSWLLRDRFESDRKIAEVHAPLLMLHGTEDDIIPLAHGRRLYERANEPKRFVEIEGAGHNDLRLAGDAYFGPLDAFLAD